jgi:vacuolar-type H+-ATPase subunit H
MLPELQKIIQADLKATTAVELAEVEAQALLSRAEKQVKAIQAELAAARGELETQIQADTVAQAEAQAREILTAADRYIEGLRQKAAAKRQEILDWLCREVLA